MPIFEFHCSQCGREFEELIISSSEAIACPDCGSSKCDKMLSSFRLGPGSGSLGSLSLDSSPSSSSSSCGSCAASSCAGCGSR
ncbi:MAG: zinc ribbon domain-containing protein [Deltaproteobacteria bacterium]|nr:zinc ribbon domain-containing protein [Deltaproteobacteria bacterium]